MELVSVGFPVRNGAASLERALTSLLSQSHTNLEIVISDNASNDGTQAICEAAARADERVRYFRNADDLGAPANFARALELARSEYFMWAAHDDYWHETYVEALVAQLRALPKCTLAAGECVNFREEEEQIEQLPKVPAPGPAETAAEKLLDNHATHWIYGVWRRERLMQEVGRYAELDPWGADLILLLRCALRGEVAGSSDTRIFKETRLSDLRPRTPRQIVRWEVGYAGRLLLEILKADIGAGRKARLLSHLTAYCRRHVFRGLAAESEIWLRAAYHAARGMDRA